MSVQNIIGQENERRCDILQMLKVTPHHRNNTSAVLFHFSTTLHCKYTFIHLYLL